MCSIQIGKIQTLQIARFTMNGAYLNNAADPSNEVLLPNKFVPKDIKISDKIDVFVYTDSLDRPVASTQTPYGTLGEIVSLRVCSIEANGCFLEFGVDKDIFMPTKNPKRFEIGQYIAVRIATDKQNRLIARLGIKEHLLAYPYKNNFIAVEILPFEKTPLGINCVVNQKYFGLLYANQIFTPLTLGVKTSAYIANIRADGKLDLSLEPIGDKSKQKARLLSLIKKQKILEFDFDSSPEAIKENFQMSKKSFKTLINILSKESKIKIVDSVKNLGKKAIQAI